MENGTFRSEHGCFPKDARFVSSLDTGDIPGIRNGKLSSAFLDLPWTLYYNGCSGLKKVPQTRAAFQMLYFVSPTARTTLSELCEDYTITPAMKSSEGKY